MRPWYDTPERIKALKIAAAVWIGTPFMTNGRALREAVDCHNLTYAIHRETGALPPLDLPRGSGRVGDQKRVATMSKHLAKIPEFAAIDLKTIFPDAGEPEFVPGDLVTFRTRTGEYHMGTWLGEVRGQQMTVIMASRHAGVTYINLFDPTYCERVVAVWRIRGEEERYLEFFKA